MQRKGRLAIVGNGLNKVDFTSVQNLNEALLSSLLATDSALGKAYNISNGAPVPLWDVVNYVMRQMEVPQVRRYRSYGLAYSVAALNEGFCKLWPGRPEPTLSRLGMQVMNKKISPWTSAGPGIISIMIRRSACGPPSMNFVPGGRSKVPADRPVMNRVPGSGSIGAAGEGVILTASSHHRFPKG
nr:hypothetical protein GCM10020185_13870 [Pseudomonas brassicacearum subsp. brassicacearum]